MPKIRLNKKNWDKNRNVNKKLSSKPEKTGGIDKEIKPPVLEYNLDCKLPPDLKKCLENFLKTNGDINFGLYINKYIEFNNAEIKILKQNIIKNFAYPNIYKDFLKKQERFFNEMRDNGYIVDFFKGSLLERMVVGLGIESVYETSITLHRGLGIPYIPGSALKGISNHRGIDEGSEIMDKIFGNENKKGEVIFMDAFPIVSEKENILDKDIMNPHYSDYYSKGEVPGDWMKLNPINFLTVKKGIKFNFCVASKDKTILKKGADLLKNALCENGVGAKTSLGYGRFSI